MIPYFDEPSPPPAPPPAPPLATEPAAEKRKIIWCKYHHDRPHRYTDGASGQDIPMHKIPLQNGKIFYICNDCYLQDKIARWFYTEYIAKNYHQHQDRVFILGKGAMCKSWIDNFTPLEEWRLY